MTPEKVKEVTAKYRRDLSDHLLSVSLDFDLRILVHCNWMLNEIDTFINKNEIEKAMRWLGFVQGCFWSVGFRSIDDMRDDNREEDTGKSSSHKSQ